MIFQSINRGVMTNKPILSCGQSNYVKVDGRLSFFNQVMAAYAELRKRNSDLIGIAWYTDARDSSISGSVTIDNGGCLSLNSLTFYNDDLRAS